MAELLGDIAATVGLREGEPGVVALLRQIAAGRAVATRRLSRQTGIPVPMVAAICGELRRAGLVAPGRPARLSEAGWALAEALGGAPAAAGCPTCQGRGVTVSGPLTAVGPHLEALLARAPAADPRLDQVHCTVEAKLRRVAYLEDAGALSGAAVLLLGDDDFLGLAIALAAAHLVRRRPRRLVVLDVDPAVIGFTEAALDRAGLDAEPALHDLRRPLPEHLLGAFDTVFTDPPYTQAGAELFLSRAAAALRPGAGRQAFCCLGPKPPDEAARLQRAIAGMGFAIHRLVRNFNDYLGAGVLGGTSHLYHLVTGDRVTPAIPDAYAGPLYTAELRGPSRPTTFDLTEPPRQAPAVMPSRRPATSTRPVIRSR